MIGYPMSKFGTVTMTRVFANKSPEGPWKKHGIKAMALCPFFANTPLVTDRISLENLDKQLNETIGKIPIKHRVLDASEVK